MTSALLRLPLATLRAAAAAFAAALALASCGGGGVSANPSPIVDSPTLTILPATAVLYSGLPTTFVLSGGTGAYVIASSDQAVIQVAGGVTGRSVTVVPNNVTADTTVTLTVRDTGTAAPVSATLTVRPGTVNNNLTITPSATQSTSCTPAVCSGGDAEVKVTTSQGGIPLAARGMRFEVISGAFAFITTPPGTTPEILATFIDTTTDETGTARARIRVTALAANQTALVKATDLATGAYRQSSFAIAQFTGTTPAFFTLPSSITFTGAFSTACAQNVATDVSIFGGTPPYSISGGSSAFTATPSTVLVNGGKFNVVLPLGASCVDGAAIGVTDATGRTISVTVNNVLGAGTAPAPAVTMAPATLTLFCGTTASLVVSGGTPPISVGVDHPRVQAVIVDRTVSLTRLVADPVGPGIYPMTGRVTVTDGVTSTFSTLTVPDFCL
ncbi:MAG: hypothetical protein AB7P08_06455 [Burkholderiales bacterium]